MMNQICQEHNNYCIWRHSVCSTLTAKLNIMRVFMRWMPGLVVPLSKIFWQGRDTCPLLRVCVCVCIFQDWQADRATCHWTASHFLLHYTSCASEMMMTTEKHIKKYISKLSPSVRPLSWNTCCLFWCINFIKKKKRHFEILQNFCAFVFGNGVWIKIWYCHQTRLTFISTKRPWGGLRKHQMSKPFWLKAVLFQTI